MNVNKKEHQHVSERQKNKYIKRWGIEELPTTSSGFIDIRALAALERQSKKAKGKLVLIPSVLLTSPASTDDKVLLAGARRRFWRNTFIFALLSAVVFMACVAGTICFLYSGRSDVVAASSMTQAGMLYGLSLVPASDFAMMWLHNVMSLAVVLFSGCVPFAFLPVVDIGANGYIVGLLGTSYLSAGIPISVFAAGILPHGILEIGMFCIAAGAGLETCRNLVMHAKQKNGYVLEAFSTIVKRDMKFLLFIGIPLLGIAAAIETFITPDIISMAAGI